MATAQCSSDDARDCVLRSISDRASLATPLCCSQKHKLEEQQWQSRKFSARQYPTKLGTESGCSVTLGTARVRARHTTNLAPEARNPSASCAHSFCSLPAACGRSCAAALLDSTVNEISALNSSLRRFGRAAFYYQRCTLRSTPSLYLSEVCNAFFAFAPCFLILAALVAGQTTWMFAQSTHLGRSRRHRN